MKECGQYRKRWFSFSACFRVPASLLLLSCLMACGAGTNFSQAEVDKLQPGITTYDQAVTHLGKPYAIKTDVKGRKVATWSYASPAGARAVAIVFDSNGVMERVAGRTDSSGTKPGPQ